MMEDEKQALEKFGTDRKAAFDRSKRAGSAAKDQAAKAGFAGKKNIYTCDKCFGHIVTVDLAEGVTPFILACRATAGCDGWMQSSLYRVFDQRMKAGFEWYRPSVAEMVPESARDHVAHGGLLIRKAS